ncbi:hypothetical protein OIE68_45525 [Nocardia vinacea]|uniref:hypothetical protein n=1 Tax=Nocardia vinacea TaxID=96468 RepID=UPI002E10BC80|nr:hypothetical protein OIE68_45525 [Nocardia vinacea]
MSENNVQLRAARQAIVSPVTGYAMSRDEVAEAANAWAHARGVSMDMSGNYVGRLERGTMRWPNADYRNALRAVLGAATDAALGFFPPGESAVVSTIAGHIIADTHHVAREPKLDEDDDMERRQLLVGGTAAGLTVITHRPQRFPTRIGINAAKRLAARVDSYVNTEQRVGGGTLATAARTDLEHAEMMLQTHDIDGAALPAFVSAAGNMAVMAGWLFYDSDDQDAATACYRDALALAAEVGDDELAAHTCLNRALQTITQARRGKANPHSALRSALRAADLARPAAAGRIHALIAARQALAHSCLGDRSAFNRSIASAWREMDLAYDHEPLDQCPDWLKFMCHNEVRYHEACGNAYLGDASMSTELFEQVAAERAGQRNAAHYRAWFACSLAQVGNIADAITEATDVITNLASGVSSSRTLRVLEPVRNAATKPHHTDFRERYDQLSIQV